MDRPPGKILGIGLSRTGTSSLNRALIVLGFSAVHFPYDFTEVELHQAATDSRVADKFQLLDQAFPGSRFILTQRRLDAWLASCEKFWARNQPRFDAEPGMAELHQRLYGTATFDRALFAQAFARHTERVLAHFAGRPGDLLVMDICAGDGWDRLCPFLGRPVPSVPFPHDQVAVRPVAAAPRRRPALAALAAMRRMGGGD